MSAAAASSPVITQSPAIDEQHLEETRWAPFLALPCQLTVDLPLPDFTVADFLALRVGSTVGTHWSLANDLPLRVNEALIGWGELEGNNGRLAVRVTELA